MTQSVICPALCVFQQRTSYLSYENKIKQAGAELGQAQLKLG